MSTIASTTGNTQAIGVAYADQNIVNSDMVYVNATGGQIGYTTGVANVPSTVTQLTSKSTGVTINASCGQIVTFNTAIAAGAEASFVVTNSMVSLYDIPIVAIASGAANAVTYAITVGAVANGSFAIVISNLSAGSLSEALTINFAILHVAQV